MKSSLALNLALTGAIALGGCASKELRWSHPEIPPEHWSADAAQCRHDALRKAEDEFFRDGGSSASDMSGAEDVSALMDQSAVKKRGRALFRSCMIELGYVAAE